MKRIYPSMKVETDDLVSVAETAKLLHLSREAIYKRIQLGHMPAIQLGGVLYLSRETVESEQAKDK